MWLRCDIASKTAQRSRSQSARTRAIVAASAVLALTGASPRVARAIDYNWNAGFGTFQTPANWTGGPVGTFPNDSTDNAIFNLGTLGYFVNFSASVTNNAARVLDDYEAVLEATCRAWRMLLMEKGRLATLTAYRYLLASGIP